MQTVNQQKLSGNYRYDRMTGVFALSCSIKFRQI